MTLGQTFFILLWGVASLALFIVGMIHSFGKDNVYGETYPLVPLGIFVWGDAIIFGFFWVIVSLLTFLLKDWLLFLLIISVFWVVRGMGETIFWLNQQFSKVKRYPPHKLWGYSLFKNDSIWFIYQTVCQLATMIAIIATIYLAPLWIKSLS